MHDLIFHTLRFVTQAPPPPSASDKSIQVAIITAISVVVAAGVTGFLTTFKKRESGNPDAQDYVDELVRRAEVAERRSANLENRVETLISRVDELETYCWRAGVDPNTGVPVHPTSPHGEANSGGPPQGE